LTRLAQLAVVWTTALFAGETIDRIAVSLGNRVITTSEIDRQVRISAFLSGSRPDLSSDGKRKTAEAMVDQKLVQRELETSRYPEPARSELDAAFAEFREKYFPSDDEYRRALSEYGIAEADVKDQLLWQRRWLSFVAARFRPAVQVTEPEVREYFEKTVLPAARAANPGATFTLEEFRDQILSKLTGDRVDQAMDQWLAEARRRTEIVFHEEAFGEDTRSAEVRK
jgi:hypothetical protein